MTPKILLRIAAILMLIFAAGHTSGHLGRKNTSDPRGLEVIRYMEQYQFEFHGATMTLDGEMEGYGLIVTIIGISITALLWIVSSRYKRDPQYSILILYPVLFFVLANGYVAYRYFFPGPAIFSWLVALLIVISIWQLAIICTQIKTFTIKSTIK